MIAAARRVRVLSRAELTELTGLSPATLTPLVRELIDEGYLVESGRGENRTGRPRAMLEFNPRCEQVVAVNLEPTRVSGELADSDGNPIDEVTIRPRSDLVAAICQVVERLTSENPTSLRGVAIAVPGIPSGKEGTVHLAPSLGLVDGRPLGEIVQQRLNVPVLVDNDVNLMVAGEHVAGAGKDVSDLLLIHVGDGIGAGLLLGGKVRHGAGGAAGEVGFLPLDASDRRRDGVGPFEARWSESAVAAMVKRLQPDRRSRSPIKALQALAHTDVTAASYLDELLDAWARLIVSCVCVIDPGRVLLGGAAAELDDESLDRIRAQVAERAPVATDVRRAVLGDRAVLHGAVSRALSATSDNSEVTKEPR